MDRLDEYQAVIDKAAAASQRFALSTFGVHTKGQCA